MPFVEHVQLPVDRSVRRRLQTGVQCCVHFQPVFVECTCAVGGLEMLADLFHEVGPHCRLALRRLLCQHDVAGAGGIRLSRGDVAVVAHFAEHVVASNKRLIRIE